MPYWADGTVVLIFLLYTIRNCSVAINCGEIKLPHNDYTSMPIRGVSETIFMKKGETWNSHVYSMYIFGMLLSCVTANCESAVLPTVCVRMRQ